MSSEATTEFRFSLPDPGEGLTEAEVVEWYYVEGDEVTEDKPLLDVETDKAVVEIPAPCDGTLASVEADPGDVVAVGEVIGVFETDNPPRKHPSGDAEVETSPTDEGVETGEEPKKAIRAVDAEETAADDEEPRDDDTADGSRVFAAPSTRRFARERGVDLGAVDGTGPGGRVLRSDVKRHLDAAPSETAPATKSVGQADRGDTREESEDAVVEPLRGLRRTIAENMQRSAREIPHVTSGFEADATELVDLKDRLDDKHEDVRITYTAVLVKAVVPALQAFPLVNAEIDMDAGEITKHRRYNVGVATHTNDGLIVPVIGDVDEKSLVEVAETLEERVTAARNREIAPENLHGGTFTITNTGSHGGHGTFGTPIIRHPEAAILGVGAIDEEAVAVDGELEVRDRIGFSFSYDHRLVDGVTAGRFMEYVIEGIEDPDLLLARL